MFASSELGCRGQVVMTPRRCSSRRSGHGETAILEAIAIARDGCLQTCAGCGRWYECVECCRHVRDVVVVFLGVQDPWFHLSKQLAASGSDPYKAC